MNDEGSRPGHSRIDWAGAQLREWEAAFRRGELSLRRPDEDDAAFDLVNQFRAAHALPLTKVVMGVRSFMQSEGVPPKVTQRLKRTPRIIDKLVRQHTMRLSQMQDIAGCRAVFSDDAVAALGGVLDRIERQWDVVRIDDYVAHPQATGYRARHAIVRREGRLIEVQLRTRGQQLWAAAIELVGDVVGASLKDAEGSPEILEVFRDASERIARSGTLPGGVDPVMDWLTAELDRILTASPRHEK